MAVPKRLKKMIAWMLWDRKVLWTKNIAAKKLLRSIGGWMGMIGDGWGCDGAETGMVMVRPARQQQAVLGRRRNMREYLRNCYLYAAKIIYTRIHKGWVSEWGSHAEKAALFRARTGAKSTKLCTICETNLATLYKISRTHPPPSSIGQHLLPHPSNHINASLERFVRIC